MASQALLLRMDGKRVKEARGKTTQKRGRGGAIRGGKANQDETWAEPNTETGKHGQNDRRNERARTEAGTEKRTNVRDSEQNR
ncbi:hypothetical protein TNIN_477111 [Trichonephila inaurata madagascariensis]|uniref:Uncharacterized protein n=1 Tax=Trichonephila inaurata madagascariensis TaxID=2747483 RepID=A0A8X6YSD8_9ARAC|nr:hypothetical protein TNIN_9251 [Trichonephila inaurata madagascariensis]GFY78355.1 hypothetical protein TNIN_477111 [Trichonephila inaurata madagascariensis]